MVDRCKRCSNLDGLVGPERTDGVDIDVRDDFITKGIIVLAFAPRERLTPTYAIGVRLTHAEMEGLTGKRQLEGWLEHPAFAGILAQVSDSLAAIVLRRGPDSFVPDGEPIRLLRLPEIEGAMPSVAT